jgi:hypothetical protein
MSVEKTNPKNNLAHGFTVFDYLFGATSTLPSPIRSHLFTKPSDFSCEFASCTALATVIPCDSSFEIMSQAVAPAARSVPNTKLVPQDMLSQREQASWLHTG